MGSAGGISPELLRSAAALAQFVGGDPSMAGHDDPIDKPHVENGIDQWLAYQASGYDPMLFPIFETCPTDLDGI